MAAPTVYQEDELAAYMLGELGDVATVLRITATAGVKGDYGDLSEPLNNVLLALGVTDVTTLTGADNIRKLRALGAVEAWRLAKKRAAAAYDFKDGSTSLSRSQLQPMISQSLGMAEAEASSLGVLPTGTGVKVKVGTVKYRNDPYANVQATSTGEG